MKTHLEEPALIGNSYELYGLPGNMDIGIAKSTCLEFPLTVRVCGRARAIHGVGSITWCISDTEISLARHSWRRYQIFEYKSIPAYASTWTPPKTTCLCQVNACWFHSLLYYGSGGVSPFSPPIPLYDYHFS